MRLFPPHHHHTLHHLQQVYFPKTCSDINPRTPNDFCCCLIQTQEPLEACTIIQLTACAKQSAQSPLPADEVIKPGPFRAILFFHITAVQVQVERCESIKVDKLSLDAKFGSCCAETEQIPATQATHYPSAGSEDRPKKQDQTSG